MTDKPELKRCAACGTEKPVSEMKICMHAQMHRYVCDMKCMNDFYNPPPKQALEPAGSYQKGYDEGRHQGTKHRVADIQQLEASRAADKARIAELVRALQRISAWGTGTKAINTFARAALSQQGKEGGV